MKTVRELWRGIMSSRRTREREAAAAAQYDRVQREGALRDDFARRTHAFEAQIAQAHVENCRLRAENRALLNSVLGIAGIPPVIVAEPPAPPSHGRHSERSEEPLFVSPGCLGAQSKRDPWLPLVAQDDGFVGDTVAPNGSASPSSFAGPARPAGGHGTAVPLPNQSPAAIFSGQNGAPELRQTPLASAPSTLTPPEAAPAPAQKKLRGARSAPHPRNDQHAIAPIRRRSWHQIYRMLEFESSRRKEQDS